jgi:hypothetical protein
MRREPWRGRGAGGSRAVWVGMPVAHSRKGLRRHHCPGNRGDRNANFAGRKARGSHPSRSRGQAPADLDRSPLNGVLAVPPGCLPVRIRPRRFSRCAGQRTSRPQPSCLDRLHFSSATIGEHGRALPKWRPSQLKLTGRFRSRPAARQQRNLAQFGSAFDRRFPLPDAGHNFPLQFERVVRCRLPIPSCFSGGW